MNAALLTLSFLLFLFFTGQGFVLQNPKKTLIFLIDEHSKPSIFPTHLNWYTSEFAEPDHILHVYDTVFHGFSASLIQEQIDVIGRNPAVLAVFEDRRRELDTTRSPQFLGLRNQRGLWSESDYGSDVIVGILDTGIWPERRSFDDRNLGPVPSRWKGVCENGVRFSVNNCNRKLIGARVFLSGQESSNGRINDTTEFRSPRDADGHGSHTASTAAGRYVFQASMAGYAAGIAKGVAPKARLAVYKVCWKDSGCFDSDILAGFDRAVSDGVDVISISIGSGGGTTGPYYLDPIAIGSYGAAARGVFVASSAGNDGPSGLTVTNLAPWQTTVGAGTIDRNFPADINLGDGRVLAGVSLYSGKPLAAGSMFPLVYPGISGVLSESLCMEDSLDPNLVRGKIVICDRGSNPRVAKGLVVQAAGGAGMVLANGLSNGEGLVGDAHVLPACAVGAAEADSVKSYVNSSKNPTATILFRGTQLGIKPAPVVASFSGRGPNGLTPEILKPDLIAPGVNILAAWTDVVGPTGLVSDHRKTEFNIISGTSMACPHVSGAAALLKGAHPDWSPAGIRSALMTTAATYNNQNQLMTDESTGKPATPYDFGSGHVNLDRAMDPGLIYDITNQDYINFLCAIGYTPRAIQVITRSSVTCPRRKLAPENLNYPSFSMILDVSRSLTGNVNKAFYRTLTNVGPAGSIYGSKIEFSMKGVNATVKPAKLAFTQPKQKLSFVLTVSVADRSVFSGEEGVVFGYVTWSDGVHDVKSPIVVTQALSL